MADPHAGDDQGSDTLHTDPATDAPPAPVSRRGPPSVPAPTPGAWKKAETSPRGPASPVPPARSPRGPPTPRTAPRRGSAVSPPTSPREEDSPTSPAPSPRSREERSASTSVIENEPPPSPSFPAVPPRSSGATVGATQVGCGGWVGGAIAAARTHVNSCRDASWCRRELPSGRLPLRSRWVARCV